MVEVNKDGEGDDDPTVGDATVGDATVTTVGDATVAAERRPASWLGTPTINGGVTMDVGVRLARFRDLVRNTGDLPDFRLTKVHGSCCGISAFVALHIAHLEPW